MENSKVCLNIMLYSTITGKCDYVVLKVVLLLHVYIFTQFELCSCRDSQASKRELVGLHHFRTFRKIRTSQESVNSMVIFWHANDITSATNGVGLKLHIHVHGQYLNHKSDLHFDTIMPLFGLAEILGFVNGVA